jgi:two-component system response regulator AtoC
VEHPCILVVDDEPHLAASIFRIFSNDSLATHHASDGKEGLKKVVDVSPDVIIVDYKMPEMDGLEFLKAVHSIRSDIPVIVMTAHGNKAASVQFLKHGAFRYLEKPFRPDEFRLIVFEALEHRRLKQENSKLHQMVELQNSFSELVGASPPMRELYQMIERISDTDVTVLLQGESGTGKELIAKAIHDKSKRAGQPFIRVNCAALPETLIESELFGHEKGAFTGADSRKLGRFELAENGTLFFDEIGELNLPMQVKLLRVLQEREFERVGGTVTVKSNVRIIAATNQSLDTMMAAGTFREDLYFRLSRFPLRVAPLRERGDDVITLAHYFLKQYASEYGVHVAGFSEGAIAMLKRYPWKGNVRELQNVISRAVILSQTPLINEVSLSLYTGTSSVSELSAIQRLAQDPITEDELVYRYAHEILKKSKGNKKVACEILGINYRTLMARLKP